MTERRGAGGTPGGMGEFLIGLVMAIAGGYLLTTCLATGLRAGQAAARRL